MRLPSVFLFRALAAAGLFAAGIIPAVAQDITRPSIFVPGIDPNENVEQINLPDTPLDGVLAQLEQLTGRIVLRPQQLPSPQIAFKARNVTRAEVLFALETSLALNGIGIVPAGEKFLKVVQVANVRTEAPELFVGSLRDEPPSGKVVSKLFRLQHIDTATFQQQAGQFLSAGFGSIVQFANSNSVIVTDTVANLQRLEYVVAEVDRRVPIEPKFYQINYANAAELAAAINRMLEGARSSLGATGGAGGRFVPAQPGQLGQPGQTNQVVTLPMPGASGPGDNLGVSLQAVVSSNTMITADERTNQLIVITNSGNLVFFDDLIAKLDVPADPLTTIEVIPMNYAKAEDLQSLLSEFISGRTSAVTASDRQPTRTTGQRGSASTNSSLNQPAQPPQPGTAAAAAAAARANAQGTLQTLAEAQSSQFSGFMTIQADVRTNTLIVAGTHNDIALIRPVIERLDTVLAQVRIEVVIAEVTLSDDVERGFDAFGIKYNDVTGATEISVGSGNIRGAPLLTGTLTGGVLRDWSIDAIVDVARTNSKVDLLSIPTIVTTHNQPASISVGERRPIPSSTSTNTGIVSTNVNYEDVAITLDVTPVIGPNDVVQLEIDQAVDDITSFVPVEGSGDVPVISSRQAISYLSAKSGQLVVIGGLQRTFENRIKTRMAILGEIPLIGELFSRTVNNKRKTELLLFLRPVVLRNEAAADADARMKIDELPLQDAARETIREFTGEEALPEAGTSEKPERPRGPR